MIKGLLTKPPSSDVVKQLHYYRVNVPRKELYILANCPVKRSGWSACQKYMEEEDESDRRQGWSPRALWLKLGEGLGTPARRWRISRDLSPEYHLLVDSWAVLCAEP